MKLHIRDDMNSIVIYTRYTTGQSISFQKFSKMGKIWEMCSLCLVPAHPTFTQSDTHAFYMSGGQSTV